MPFPTVSHTHPLDMKQVQYRFLTVTVMPKKRGRPPKKQMGAKRGRDRPRKNAQTAPAQPTRRSSRMRQEEEASATVSEVPVTHVAIWLPLHKSGNHLYCKVPGRDVAKTW